MSQQTKLKPLSYPEFMRGLCNAPWDDDKCGKCGGVAARLADLVRQHFIGKTYEYILRADYPVFRR